jgi:hypothetical protein
MNPIKKWAKHLNRHFSKEDIQMTNRCMKICSILLTIREMQMKITMRYPFSLVRVTIIKKDNKKYWWRYRQRDSHTIVGV